MLRMPRAEVELGPPGSGVRRLPRSHWRSRCAPSARSTAADAVRPLRPASLPARCGRAARRHVRPPAAGAGGAGARDAAPQQPRRAGACCAATWRDLRRSPLTVPRLRIERALRGSPLVFSDLTAASCSTRSPSTPSAPSAAGAVTCSTPTSPLLGAVQSQGQGVRRLSGWCAEAVPRSGGGAHGSRGREPLVDVGPVAVQGAGEPGRTR